MKKEMIMGFALTILALLGFKANGQIQDTILNAYSNQTEITAGRSVTLKEGFYIPAGKTVRIYTTGISFKDYVTNFVGIPSAGQNYISTRVFKIAGVSDSNLEAPRKINEVNQTVRYFDGLGRSLQTVTTQGSPSYKDLVQPVAYDGLGREATRYLPYSTSGTAGSYRADALAGASGYANSGQKTFYNQTGQNYLAIPSPYSQTVFESSPLNRVLEQGAPGDIWQPVATRTNTAGRTVVTVYGTNAAEVKLWGATANGASSTASYLAGKLYKVTNKDENWVSVNGKGGTVDEYKDFEDHVVLKRVWETDTKSLSTYYVYDDLGNLRYVLPPAVNENGQSTMSSFTDGDAVFKNFIYGYRYDERNRLIEKKLPGKEWERMVYNKLDQLVLTQDSLLSKNKQWVYSKYDILGRAISSGIYTNTTVTSRAALQAIVDGPAAILWESRRGTDYTNVAFPQSGTEIQVLNYYDDYDILGTPNNQSANYSKKLKGLLTANKVKVLGTVNDYLWTVNYYDEEARVVKVYKQHYLGGAVNASNYDEIENTYSFAGELTSSNRIHRVGTTVTTIANRYEYDHMGRKLAVFEKINGGTEVVLNKLDYNEIGQLLKKSVHSTDGTNFIQSNTYAYNPRGWMTRINNPDAVTANTVFGMELTYADRANCFNGNISGVNWNTKVPASLGLTETRQSYVYDYDNLNRLTKAGYTTSGAVDKFNEELSYDVMGNISTLKRRETTTGYLNNFTYNYTNGTVKGNQLMGVTDAGTALQSSNYQYDENGNQKSDSRKGLTIAYNMLNLPKTITKTSTGENLNYIYDATGQKLRKILGASTRDYIGGIEYNTGTIEFIQTEEGRAIPGSSYTYEYMLKDHLGNTRATVKQNGEIVQVQDYYAFGLEMNPGNSRTPSPNNLYRYNCKEKQTELSLDQLDYGARFYDPVIGRWNVVDPLAEKDRKSTPYSYAFNNPILFIDPDGMFGDYYDLDGTYLGNDGKDDKKVYAVKKGDYKSLGNGKSSISKSTELKGITNEILLAFAAVINKESGGEKNESYAIGNVTMNFIDAGGSRGVPTLEDAVMYDNGFAQGATQKNYSSFMDSSPDEQNSKGAVGAAINAIGFSQKLTGFKDFSGGANSWDGIDLVSSTTSNIHRNYIWSNDSKSLLSQYKRENQGGVNVSGFKYKSSGYQISATKIIGSTLYTNLATGRGERNQSKIRFQR